MAHPYRLGFAVKVLGGPEGKPIRTTGGAASQGAPLEPAKAKDLAVEWLRAQLERVAPELAAAEER